MSTATEDRTERESPVDAALEGIPFNDLEAPPSELAAETPLTEAAVTHLRAAAAEVSRGFSRVSSILGAIKRGLYNPVVGDDLTLDEDTAFELRELCDAAVDVADHKMQRPVFERGRGERPHGGVQENGDGPAGTGGPDRESDHPRGVFHQTYRGPDSEEVLVAVDRSGRSLVRTFVPNGADRDAVVRTMKRLLRHLEGPEPVGSEDDGTREGETHE